LSEFKTEFSDDRVEITRNSLGKIVSISSNTKNLKYTYDSQNRLASMTDIPTGNITRYGYDLSNKLAVTVGKNSAVTDLGGVR
jgi:YD repeat-containing protein